MKQTLAFVALSLALVAPAHAQSCADQIAQMNEKFKAADKDGDGKLTKQEASDGGMTRIAQNFARLDRDGDGFIDYEQIKAQIEARCK